MLAQGWGALLERQEQHFPALCFDLSYFELGKPYNYR